MDDFPQKWRALKQSKMIWLFAGFYGIHVLGLVVTEDMAGGLFELQKLLPLLALPVIIGTSPALTEKQCGRVEFGFVISCVLISLVSLGYDAFHFSTSPFSTNFDPSGNERYHQMNPGASRQWDAFSYIGFGQGLHLHPTYLSMYLVLCVILLYKSNIRLKTVYRVALSIYLTAILVSLSSRAGILVYIGAVIMIIFDSFVAKKKLFTGVALTFLFLAFMALITYVHPVARYRLWQEPGNTNYSITSDQTSWNSVNLRLIEWSATWKVIIQHGMTGTGTGDFGTELKKEYKHRGLSQAYQEYDAHNQFLQTMAMVGIPGLALLVGLLAVPLAQALNHRYFVTLFFVLSFSLFCLTESMLERQKGIVYFAFFGSYFLFVVPEKKKE